MKHRINKYLTILFAKLTVHFFNKVTGGGANVTDREPLKANLYIWVWNTVGTEVGKGQITLSEKEI